MGLKSKPLPIRQQAVKARRNRINQEINKIENQHGKFRTIDQTYNMLRDLIIDNPMTTHDIAKHLGVSLSAVQRYSAKFTDVNPVDYYYSNKTLSALIGISEHALTREEWFIKNGIPLQKNERKRLKRINGAPYLGTAKPFEPAHIPESIKKQLSFYGVPAKVKERFDLGASVVVFEGKKYSRESNHG
jgi:DNA-binding transcriptional regulator LsrR (DeoR family)